MSMFRHATVSACCCVVSGVVSFASSRATVVASSRRGGGGGFWASQLLFPLAGVPDFFGGICVLVVLFHLRTIERRWGSAKYLTFLLWISVVNYVIAVLLLGSRGGTVSALLLPMVALTFRYYLEVPGAVSSHVVGPVSVSDKVFIFGVVAKLLLFPGANVHELGFVPRVFTAVVGASVSYLFRPAAPARGGAQQQPVHRTLDWLERRVIGPIWSRVLAVPFRHTLAAPRVVRRKAMLPQADPDAVPEDVLAQIAAMEGREADHAAVGVSQRARGRLPQTGPQTPALGAQPSPPQIKADPQSVRAIEELHLGVSRTEILHALEISGGNVDGAVALLLGGAE